MAKGEWNLFTDFEYGKSACARYADFFCGREPDPAPALRGTSHHTEVVRTMADIKGAGIERLGMVTEPTKP